MSTESWRWGVPGVVRHNNLKTGAVRACFYGPDLSKIYEAFARHWASC